MAGNSFLNILSEVLFHSLWQGALCLTLILILIHIFRQNSPLRYWFSVSGLLLLPLINTITFFILWLPDKAVATGSILSSFPPANNFHQLRHYALDERMNQYLIYAWLSGVLVFSLYRFMGLVYLQKIKYRATSALQSSAAVKIMNRNIIRLKIARKVNLKISESVQSPFTFGIFRPVIMMPLAMLEWMNTDQLEAIIVHELIHIRRLDYLIHLLISYVEIVYFFNPTVWIMKKLVSQEREFSCDYLANVHLKEPLTYCKTLFQLQSGKHTSLPVLSFHHKKNILMKRIQKLFGNYQAEFPLIPMVTAALVLIFFMSGYQSVPEEKFNLSITDEFSSNTTVFMLPPKPKTASVKQLQIKPSAVEQIGNFLPVKAIAPRLILDDTIKIKLRKDEEIEIKSKAVGKTIYLDQKEVSKEVLENLNPEDIKSITVEEDEIFIQTKKYKIRNSISLHEKNEVSIRTVDKNNETPLYVLDGEIVENNILKEINPNDIESIEVLKNESATAVYGEKGKNGVIVIKLKK